MLWLVGWMLPGFGPWHNLSLHEVPHHLCHVQLTPQGSGNDVGASRTPDNIVTTQLGGTKELYTPHSVLWELDTLMSPTPCFPGLMVSLWWWLGMSGPPLMLLRSCDVDPHPCWWPGWILGHILSSAARVSSPVSLVDLTADGCAGAMLVSGSLPVPAGMTWMTGQGTVSSSQCGDLHHHTTAHYLKSLTSTQTKLWQQ